MGTNPNVSGGKLNRLIGSIVIADVPELNVVPEFLGEEGIGLAFQGETTTFIPALTTQVKSPEIYQAAVISVHLLRTQSLATLYKAQIEADCDVGDVVVRVDTRAMTPFLILNCSIQNVEPLRINGKDAGYRVSIQGYYPINNDLWDQ